MQAVLRDATVRDAAVLTCILAAEPECAAFPLLGRMWPLEELPGLECCPGAAVSCGGHGAAAFSAYRHGGGMRAGAGSDVRAVTCCM